MKNFIICAVLGLSIYGEPIRLKEVVVLGAASTKV